MLSRVFILKNHKGFSLVEIIIAVAVLALLSGYVLQSFIVSQELNKKAADLDTANAITVAAIETFKASPEAVLQKQYQPLGKNSWQAVSYYDADWQTCNTEDATFVLTSHVNKDDKNIYTIKATTEKIAKDGAKETVVSLETIKYLPGKAVV